MINRTNMILRQAESWRPLAFRADSGTLSRVHFALRRFLDLQTASIWQDLRRELPRVEGAVVDVGCGAQPWRPLFGPAAVYKGIDTADARENFDYEVPDTLYYEGSVWPLADASADFILCTETLEHVPETKPFLAQAARCLTPGGRLLLTVPFAARWHYIPHDYWRFTPSSLHALLTEAGFGDVAVYARGNEVTVACYKGMALLLPLLVPRGKNWLLGIAARLLGLLLSPLLILLAAIGNLSLRGKGGDDCLGYTALARKL